MLKTEKECTFVIATALRIGKHVSTLSHGDVGFCVCMCVTQSGATQQTYESSFALCVGQTRTSRQIRPCSFFIFFPPNVNDNHN